MTGTTASPIRPTPSERLRAAALMGGGVTFDQVFADDLLAEIAALKRERAKAVAFALLFFFVAILALIGGWP